VNGRAQWKEMLVRNCEVDFDHTESVARSALWQRGAAEPAVDDSQDPVHAGLCARGPLTVVCLSE